MAENGSSQGPGPARRNSLLPPQAPGGPKIRRRNRIITSCLECRRRKLKCDRAHPCNHCVKASRDCVFLSPALDSATKGKLNQFKESIDHLEKGLEREATGPNSLEWTVASASDSVSSNSRYSYREPIPADEQNLEPSPLAVADVTYDDDADDLMDDLGIRLGKIRITERIGGFIRPKFSEELSDRIPGSQSPEVFPSNEMPSLESFILSPPMSEESSHSYMDPSPEYIAPGANLLSPHGISDDVSLITFLPSRDFADRLILRYWTTVHQIARVVHRPTFERQYTQFWADVAQGFEPPASLQALVFGAMFSAAVALPAENAEQEFGCSRDDMVRTFRAGCEHALGRSNLIRTTKFATIQAFIMYLIPLCRAEVSRSHASLVSMAIRLAECAGLHRDPTTFGLSPVDVHMRRLAWAQLCFLDIRTVEAVGPRPSIRYEDYDTRLPLHIDDNELESLVPPKQDAARFTDMTVSRIRFEGYELLRTIWVQRPIVEKGQMSLTSLMRRVEEWRERAVAKYMPLIDKSIPIHGYAAKMLQMLFYKMHINILHRYAVSVPKEMPDRLMQFVWSSGASILEASVELDSFPAFKPWAWYLGATQQWHVALLMIFLISKVPDHREAERIWFCLDYIFEFPTHMSRNQKIDYAFQLTKHRLEEYQKQRKQRFPTSVEQSMGVVSKPPETKHRDGLAASFNSMRNSPPSSTALDPSLGVRGNSPANSESWGLSQGTNRSTPSFSSSFDPQGAPFQAVDQQTARPDYQAAQMGQTQNITAGVGVSAAVPQQTYQTIANLDLDELEQLLPSHDPFLNFEQAQPQNRSVTATGIPAMTLFPDPVWIRSQQASAGGQNYGS